MEVPSCVRVPKFAYRYWPKGDEAVQAPGKFGRRLIFSRQEFTDTEETLLQELEGILDTYPDKGLLESLQRHELLRFAYAGKWDARRAADMIVQHLDWMVNELPSYYPNLPPLDILVSDIQNSGGMYLYGRDLKYRPVLVLIPSKLKDFPLHRLLQAGSYLLEYLLDYMLLPGQIENLGLIVDFSGGESVVCSIEELKQVTDFFTGHYPCRLAWGCALNGRYSLWTRTTAVLDPDTSDKFLYNPSPAKLFSLCHPTQIEAKYQGQAPNSVVYWPPNFPKLARSLLTDTDCTSDPEYSSYQEYHPERSLTDTSGFGTEGETSYRNAIEAVPGDQGNISMDSEDIPEVKRAEDQELAEAMETLRGKVILTKVKNRNRDRKPVIRMEQVAIRQRGWCSCVLDTGAPESNCRIS